LVEIKVIKPAEATFLQEEVSGRVEKSKILDKETEITLCDQLCLEKERDRD
jgi:hypothetical protein